MYNEDDFNALLLRTVPYLNAERPSRWVLLSANAPPTPSWAGTTGSPSPGAEHPESHPPGSRLPLRARGAPWGSSPLRVAFYGEDGVVQAPRVLRVQRLVLFREAVRARRAI